MSKSLLFHVKFEMQEGITREPELPGVTLSRWRVGTKW
jgi:hypothetical protein